MAKAGIPIEMKRTMKIFFLACITIELASLSMGVSAQVESGWKGIMPLKTDVSTVNNLLGPPEIDENGYYRYETPEAFVRVNFASAPCAPDPRHPGIKRGRYRVPAGTVLDYYVVLAKPIRLHDLGLDLGKFYREESIDTPDVGYYEYIGATKKTSNQNGVSVGASIQQGVEYVSLLTYYPREAEKDLVRC